MSWRAHDGSKIELEKYDQDLDLSLLLKPQEWILCEYGHPSMHNTGLIRSIYQEYSIDDHPHEISVLSHCEYRV